MVSVGQFQWPMDGSNFHSGGDLHHSTKFANSLRDLRAGVRIYTERGLRRLHTRLLRHGGLVRQCGSLRNRLLLPALHWTLWVGPGALYLRSGSYVRVECSSGMGLGLRYGHGVRLVVQSVVGTRWILGLGLRSARLGMGRLWRCSGGQCLWTLG